MGETLDIRDGFFERKHEILEGLVKTHLIEDFNLSALFDEFEPLVFKTAHRRHDKPVQCYTFNDLMNYIDERVEHEIYQAACFELMKRTYGN